jgi:predicted nucleic acid-binding protein
MTDKPRVFVDSNIPMYAAGKEHPNKAASIEILESISEGSLMGITSTEVFQEILYRYQAIDLLDKGFEVFDNFSGIIDETLSINSSIMREARNILEDKKISTRDAIHVATMDYYDISYIASHDRHFQEFKHIRYFSL